ncbi:MAG: GNAT family N-acetyltransferase [Bacteroidetes bacterium]|nr:GNAT family N-acetyltransferase [Bacteroidota bacterium]
MKDLTKKHPIQKLTPETVIRINRSPLLNIDTFIIPSPYIKDAGIMPDYEHSYYWGEEGEILGYIQVYSDAEKTNFHIYKIVTSPFGRGRGIGTTFIEHLADNIPPESTVYLYLWEKQPDTLEYFKNKGFTLGETIVYRNLIYYHLSATPKDLLKPFGVEKTITDAKNDDIGKARHDARKTIRFLSHMVDSLSNANSGKIIEDINRETTTLVNILNRFRDTIDRIHEVNLRDLILERIIPYVEASSVSCRLHFSLDSDTSVVLGYYVNFSRALVNVVSNSLDAIREKGEKGVLHIDLRDKNDRVVLRIKDNGIGMSEDMLKPGADGIPSFVGKSTKGRRAGEGLGSMQIYSAFGKENIDIKSSPGNGAVWTINFDRPPKGASEKLYAQLERRFNEFQNLIEVNKISKHTPRNTVIAYIWQIRKMELFIFDLILQFSMDHNIRTIYRMILSYLRGNMNEDELNKEIESFRGDHTRIQQWLFKTACEMKGRMALLNEVVALRKYRGPLFRSYGQAIDNVIIFTMNPETGKFLATDRKLAEHLDFAPYLGENKEVLLRGEFVGDLNNHQQAITLGVWSILSEEDLHEKLLLIQKGAVRMMAMGVHKKKKLSFYQTTYVRSHRDINPDISTTFGEIAHMKEENLKKFTRYADTDLDGFLMIQD